MCIRDSFHRGACHVVEAEAHHRAKLSIATLTTLLLGYKTAAKLHWMGRIESDRETVQLLDDAILHEMPYISDYI